MKKRFLAMLVSIMVFATMLSPLGVLANASTVTKTHMNVNFENWTSVTANLSADGSTVGGNTWAGGTSAMSLTTDEGANGNVLKIPVGTADFTGLRYFVRSRFLNGIIPGTYANCDVLWTEFSIKYEGGFVGFGFSETDSAGNIVSINKNGSLELGTRWGYGEVGGGNYSRGTEIPDSQLEVGKWYHIAYAVDFTDASASSSGAPVYIWINGEMIGNAMVTSNIKSGSVWKFHKMWIDAAEDEGRTVYIDNLKLYETEAVDTHIEDEFNVRLEDENYDDYITVEDETIKTPSKATVAMVKAAFPGVDLKFMKDGEEVTDETTKVSDVTALVYSANGMIFKEFSFEPDTVTYPVTVTESYADVSGEDEYSVGDVVTIDAGRKPGHKFIGWTVEGIELSEDELEEKTVTFTMDTTSKTFTANWEYIPTYAVDVAGSFAQSSGTGLYYEGEDVTVDAGEKFGYIFEGWTVEGIELTEDELNSQTITFTMDTTPKTFTANWYIIPKYKVEINGSYAETSGAGEYYEGETVTISAGQKPKAEFNRWKPYGAVLDNAYNETTTFVMPAANVKINVNWYTYASTSGGGGGGGASTPSYTITFVTNGGSEVAPVKIEKGASLAVELPVKEGYIFDSWYFDEELTERVPFTYKAEKAVTLYAGWIDEAEIKEEIKEEPKEEEWQNPFNDVKHSAWYFEPVKYMYEKQYCEGFGWGQFGPDVSLSRAMLVTILYRVEGEPAVTSNGGFADVASGSWYENAVAWASANGIVTGYNSYTFAPDDLITREQIAAILYRYAQMKGQSTANRKDISSFGDFWAVSSYATDALSWTVANGYISGRTESELAPQNSATRAEAMTILYRFINK